MFNIPPNTL